ncbi:hypothetical protein MBLNU459_g4763t1 [Dothideomycetes sp. NU459]
MTSSRQSFRVRATGKDSNQHHRHQQQPPDPGNAADASANAALAGAARAFIKAQPTKASPESARPSTGSVSPQSATTRPLLPGPSGGPASRRGSWETRELQQAQVHVQVQAQTQTQTQTQSQTGPPRNDSLQPTSFGRLGVSKTRARHPVHSPSSIAATLAAARASPAGSSASPPGRPADRSLPPTKSHAAEPAAEGASHSDSPVPPPPKLESVSPVSGTPDRLDVTSIPATTSLVRLFEEKSNNSASKSPAEMTPIHSPKPLRKSSLLDDRSALPVFLPVLDGLAGASTGRIAFVDREDGGDDASSVDSFTSAKEIRSPPVSPEKKRRPPAPAPRRVLKTQDVPRVSTDGALEPSIHVRPPTRNGSKAIEIKHANPSPASSAQSDHARQPPQSITALYNQMHPRRVTPLTTGDSLANAIVASSLASSRVPSPTKLPPAPVMRRKSSSVSHVSHSLFSRTPSPPKKGMRHTMRKADSASSDDDDKDPYGKHKKKRFVRKHPNKHHEGDRKRWRDAVTLRERKRYEGVWAANKGLHVLYTPLEQDMVARQPDARSVVRMRDAVAEQVSNVVTRDIWSRSRMPAHILEQVWDLVDTQANGRLLKEEFVVGLWLIDQLLKGRKLPVKVSETVWNSVKFLQGIALPKKT